MTPLIKNSTYLSTYPYPHGIIDGYWSNEMLDNILREWPDVQDTSFWQNKMLGKNKSRYKSYGPLEEYPESVQALLRVLHGEEFIQTLCLMTGYAELIPDPALSQGAGMIHMPPGGVVPLHHDALYSRNSFQK